VKLEFDIQGLDGALEMLKSLPPEVVSKNGGPVRVALRKAATMLAKQAQANFVSAVAQAGKSGITDSSGFTAAQIKAKRGRKMPRGIRGERQLVTVRYVLHPSGNKFRNRPVRANDIAFIMEHGSKMENGTSRQPATPWLRPAYESKRGEAVAIVQRELPLAIQRVVKRLAKQKGGR
jgi:hypothetical protein